MYIQKREEQRGKTHSTSVALNSFLSAAIDKLEFQLFPCYHSSQITLTCLTHRGHWFVYMCTYPISVYMYMYMLHVDVSRVCK